MGFWSEIVGQQEAIATLTSALRQPQQLAHAWLVIGPPGSGRYNLALRFATALVAPADATGQQLEMLHQQVTQGTHPDVKLVRTQTSELAVAQMREAVATAYFAPAASPRRVIVIEDADRMNAQAANAALKALEEPPASTVWILCSPSEADLLPTIRSRTRVLRLTTPDVPTVAQLLTERDGVTPELATRVAQLAQGHIGVARQLAADPEALQRRLDSINTVLALDSLAGAMAAAGELLQAAQTDAETLVSSQLERERAALFHSLGLQPGEKIPREQARAFRELEETGKRRRSRAVIDGVDRVLVDLLTVCRDAAVLHLGAAVELVNTAQQAQLEEFVARFTLAQVTEFAGQLEQARLRLTRNIQPALVLEAALVSLITLRR